ncbi:hypothetical protein [Haloferax volcanii]|uniref:hypothetical protein n=1 Tax=Haloferax volcanii TaxID=2246 RepID=UPI00249B3BEE|nr:hypothetical protein [Haloferax alexandrinus]WEL29859.1 hypothetical protein HBNXHx_1753 [Haloferax alexandrinus]
MPPLSTENSVLAKAVGSVSRDDGIAAEALDPGQGVVHTSGGYAAAGADSRTCRVAREQRNPGSRGIEDNESPLEKPWAANNNVETLGLRSHDQARLLLAYADVDGDQTDDTYTEGTEVGWNANGYLEVLDGTPTVAIGRIVQEDSVTLSNGDNPVHVLVEFY